jgi:hypothetical protein
LDLWAGKARLDWAALARAARTFRRTRLRKAGPISQQVGRQGLAISSPDAREPSLAWPLMEKLYENIRKLYRPRKLNCRGIIVVANSDEETRIRRSARHDLGWNDFFGGDLQIITAANDHLALPRDYNRELELKLVAALDRLN